MELSYQFISNRNELSSLDFTEDNKDLLGVHDFAINRAFDYHENKLSTVRIVKEKGTSNIIAYFAVSMSAISIEDLESSEQVNHATPIRYPALLIGQLGVDTRYRGRGIGKEICNFCLGLAQVVGESVSCRYVTLQTNENKTALYEHMKFTKSPKMKNKKIWMYRRVF